MPGTNCTEHLSPHRPPPSTRASASQGGIRISLPREPGGTMRLGGETSASDLLTSKPGRWWDLNARLRMAELNHRDQPPLSPFSGLTHSSHPPEHSRPGSPLAPNTASVDRSTPSSGLCIGWSSLGRPPVPDGRCRFQTPHPHANGPLSVVIVVTVTLLGLFLQGQGGVCRAWPRVNARAQPSCGSK